MFEEESQRMNDENETGRGTVGRQLDEEDLWFISKLNGIEPKVETAVVSSDERPDRSPLRALAAVLVWIAGILFPMVPGTPGSDLPLDSKLGLLIVWSGIMGVPFVRSVKALIAARSITAFDARVHQIAPRRLAVELSVTADRPLEAVEIDLGYELVNHSSWANGGSTTTRHAQNLCPGGRRPATGQEYVGSYELTVPTEFGPFVGWSYTSKSSERNWFVRVFVKVLGRPEYARDIPIWVRPAQRPEVEGANGATSPSCE